jgi:ATP-dependent Zn protease
MPRNNGLSAVAAVAAVLLVVLLGIGLLYAYRSQTPAVQPVSYTQALTEIQSGQVRAAVVEGQRVTLMLIDGSQQQTVAPDNGDALGRAVADRSRADPAHPIDVRFSSPAEPGLAPLLGLLLGTLPLLVLIALVVLAATAFTRSHEPQRYEALARIADLRDRGVLSEEEFQREKRRLLK